MGKELILFDDYKKGFAEISKLVDSFTGISNGSQRVFLDARQNMLVFQLKNIETAKTNLEIEIKKVLVRYNSEILALANVEEYLQSELKKCDELQQIVTQKESNKAAEAQKENENPLP